MCVCVCVCVCASCDFSDYKLICQLIQTLTFALRVPDFFLTFEVIILLQFLVQSFSTLN